MNLPVTKTGRIDHDAMANDADQKSVAFIRKHIRKKGHQPRKTALALYCKCFKSGLCTAHDTRPTMCRSYFCHAALEGRIPGREAFRPQIDAMVRAGHLDKADVPPWTPPRRIKDNCKLRAMPVDEENIDESECNAQVDAGNCCT